MKTCTKCGLEKTLDSFHKRKASKDGLIAFCKACMKAYQKAYHEANKEEREAYQKAYHEANKEESEAYQKAYREAHKENNKAYQKAYRESNKEKVKARVKAWYEANKEKAAAYQKDYRESNKEKAAAKNSAWYQANPDKKREYCRKRRAKKLEVNENYTKEDEAFTKNLFDHACFNCGSTENLEVDHYRPLSKGYALTLTNAIILCKSCNTSKGPKDPEEFFNEEQTMIIQEVFDMVEEQV